MQKPHQRKNAVSNTQVGIDFEAMSYEFFKDQFPSLKRPFWLPADTDSHVIPDEVEFWEVNEENGKFSKIEFDISSRFSGSSIGNQ